LTDSVAKGFLASKRATLIRRQRANGKEDSKRPARQNEHCAAFLWADFCNTIGTWRTCRDVCRMAAIGRRAGGWHRFHKRIIMTSSSMTFSRRRLIALFAAAPLPALASPCCGPIRPNGERLRTLLDASDVDHLWLAGKKVDWVTGIEIGTDSTASLRHHTHCSAFAAAISMRLGVYLLRPPEHGETLLANGQFHWLESPAGAAHGWRQLTDLILVQTQANLGDMVVAIAENPNNALPGHATIVRPSEIDAETLQRRGPPIIMAGTINFRYAHLDTGMRHHRGAWEPGGTGTLRFYAHAVEWSKLRT
jgi:hypothetical protein